MLTWVDIPITPADRAVFERTANRLERLRDRAYEIGGEGCADSDLLASAWASLTELAETAAVSIEAA